MSHLHIPDGLLAPFWLIAGFVLSFAWIGLALYQLRGADMKKHIPKLGMISAIALVAMSIPLGPLPAHLNLTVLIGILLGPWWGILSVFIINLLLGFIGHGGMSVIGLNTLIIGSEVLIGYLVFSYIRDRISLVKAVAVTVALTIVLSNSLMVGILAISHTDPGQLVEFMGEDIHGHEASEEESHEASEEDSHGVTEEESHEATEEESHEALTGSRGDSASNTEFHWEDFLVIVIPVALLGIVLEGLAISGILKFLQKVRPDYLDI